jgi:hypothetical protein
MMAAAEATEVETLMTPLREWMRNHIARVNEGQWMYSGSGLLPGGFFQSAAKINPGRWDNISDIKKHPELESTKGIILRAEQTFNTWGEAWNYIQGRYMDTLLNPIETRLNELTDQVGVLNEQLRVLLDAGAATQRVSELSPGQDRKATVEAAKEWVKGAAFRRFKKGSDEPPRGGGRKRRYSKSRRKNNRRRRKTRRR